MKAILLLTVFSIPLLGASNSFGYEQIKVLFFIVSISLIGLFWLITRPVLRWSSITKAGGIFVTILLITSILGIDFKSSFLGSDPYFQGWVVYAYLFLFSVMVSWARVKLEQWAIALVGSASLVAILAIKDWILLNFYGQAVQTYAGRIVSSFGQPNFYAGFLLLTLPFSYYLLVIARTRRRQGRGNLPNQLKIATLTTFARDDNLRVLGWASGLVSMVGILVSYSRLAVLMALLLLILGLLDQLKIKFKIGLTIFGIIIVSIIIALKMSSGIVGNEVSQPILTKNPDLTKESVEKRAYIWPLGLKIALQKPFTGYGLENIGKAFTDYFEKNKHLLFEENLKISPVLISLKELNIDRSHNYILDLMLFSGILGLLGWLGLLGVLFKKLRHLSHGRRKNVLVVSLITYLIWIQFQNQSIVHLIYFWLLVGLVDQQRIDRGR